MYTDASGALGFGANFGSRWCYGKWPATCSYRNIAILEFYPIVLSLYLWGHVMRNLCILFFTVNESLVHVINKQSSKDKSLMFFVRKLVLICLEYNIVFKAKHIAGVKNRLADSLSRLQVQTIVSCSHGQASNGDPPASAAPELAAMVATLMQSSLQSSSLPTYQRAWNLFHRFTRLTFPGLPLQFPISIPMFCLFIAYLYDLKYAASTVNTYVSALSYSHKLSGYPDPSKASVVVQMLKGYGKLHARLDSRLPITIPICISCCNLLRYYHCQNTRFLCFRPCAALQFFGFLRVGEITFSATTPRPIQIHQLKKLVNDAHEVVGFKIEFLNFKHSYNQPPFYLVISPQSTFCPVKILPQFLSARGDSQGALFIQDDGSPVSRSCFSAQLSSALKLCGLNPSVYKGHSFRIGAASHAAERGLSDAQIRILGRWKSNAFLKYIRVSSLSS